MGTMSRKCSGIAGILTMAGAMLLFTGCSQTQEEIYQIPEDKKLVIYTSHKEDVYEPIIKEFEERTGIFVELKAGDTIALFDECRDYFQPYTVSEAERIQEQYRAEEDVYTPFSVLPTVFIYNNKLVYPVAAPKTWAELQTDRWEGKIAFADPTKSGSSYTLCCKYWMKMRRRFCAASVIPWMAIFLHHPGKYWRK